MVENCIFCRIIKGGLPCDKVFESENFIGILDISPVVEGHALIIPKKHCATVLEMPSELGSELLDAIKKVGGEHVIKKEGNGFNVVQSNFKSAQQEVGHVHFHVVPRSDGDGLRYRF